MPDDGTKEHIPPPLWGMEPPGSLVQLQQVLGIFALSLLSMALLVYLLREFSVVLQQLLVAAFLGYLIVPAHHWLIKRGLPPILSGIVLLVGFLVTSYVVGRVFYTSFEDLAAKLPTYRRNFNDLAEKLAQQARFQDKNQLRELILGESRSVDNGIRTLRSALGTFFSFLEQAIVVLVYLGFLLVERPVLARRVAAAFDPSRSERILHVTQRINESIQQYLVVKTVVSALVGGLTVAVLLPFGVDYPFLWGIVAFLANYIPYIGSLIGVVLPVALCLVQYQSLARAVLVFGFLEVVHQGVGFIIEPRMAAHHLNLSPLVIVFSLALGGAIWGVVGMILAVPLAVVVKVVLENIEPTRPLAILMSNLH